MGSGAHREDRHKGSGIWLFKGHQGSCGVPCAWLGCWGFTLLEVVGMLSVLRTFFGMCRDTPA